MFIYTVSKEDLYGPDPKLHMQSIDIPEHKNEYNLAQILAQIIVDLPKEDHSQVCGG